ncbi:MAG: RDD family protein [Pseudonocardiaceae bacterium]
MGRSRSWASWWARWVLPDPPQPMMAILSMRRDAIGDAVAVGDEKAPKPPAPQATETPARQAGSSVPIAGSVASPDPASPTAEPPIQPAIELPLPRRRFGSGVIARLTAGIGLALGRPGRFLRRFRSSDGAPDTSQLPGSLAGFGARVCSFLIDVVVPSILCSAVVIPTAIFIDNSYVLNPDDFVPALLTIIASTFVLVAFTVWNSGYRQGTTGQSIGRRVTKTKLVKIETGEPVGFGMALLRLICVAVTLIPYSLFLGYLWSLWDPKRQTVTDKIVKAVVVRIDDATT